jgi:tetratricopeptide (TPR) repeat protein
MFELLLQADKALANGALDQAEKTYWQLIELDPTNAIAVAGLARVSMERGDERLARTFADRALSIDPESIAARRVLETLEHRSTGTAEPDSMAGPLRAAEQLEALSRRRGTDNVGAVEASESSGTQRAAGKARGKTAAAPPTGREAARGGGAESAGPARSSRGRTRPDQIGPLPAEPLPERRKAGRLAAAAAAAAATREPARLRHAPHHAMPPGRRFFEPGLLKSTPPDAFSDAEMAAAVEAVDALDDAGPTTAQSTAPQPDGGVGDLGDVLRAVDATGADETVALRIALVSGAVDLEAAEREAAEFAGLADRDMFEAGEAGASAALAAAIARAESLPPEVAPPAELDVETGADEFEAAEAQAQSQAGRELGPRWDEAAETKASGFGEKRPIALPEAHLRAAGMNADELERAVDSADADAAEAAAASEAVQELARDTDADADERPLPRRAPGPAMQGGGEGPSEEEAEAQALREAMAIVLDAEGAVAAAGESGPPAGDKGPTRDAAPKPEEESASEAETEGEGESSRRKSGLFHRFRGN